MQNISTSPVTSTTETPPDDPALTFLPTPTSSTPVMTLMTRVSEELSKHERSVTSPKAGTSTLGHNPDSVVFLLLPLIVIVVIALASGIALYCISKRRRLDRLRHHLIPLYTFAPGEEDEWGGLLNQAEQSHKLSY